MTSLSALRDPPPVTQHSSAGLIPEPLTLGVSKALNPTAVLSRTVSLQDASVASAAAPGRSEADRAAFLQTHESLPASGGSPFSHKKVAQEA